MSKIYVEAMIVCSSVRLPQEVITRLSHPAWGKVAKVVGGTYDDADESLIIRPFPGKAAKKV